LLGEEFFGAPDFADIGKERVCLLFTEVNFVAIHAMDAKVLTIVLCLYLIIVTINFKG